VANGHGMQSCSVSMATDTLNISPSDITTRRRHLAHSSSAVNTNSVTNGPSPVRPVAANVPLAVR
jgi:hypothetical protein